MGAGCSLSSADNVADSKKAWEKMRAEGNVPMLSSHKHSKTLFLGLSRSGKSSLIQALVNFSKNKGSSVPLCARTRCVREFIVQSRNGPFTVVDTPGRLSNRANNFGLIPKVDKVVYVLDSSDSFSLELSCFELAELSSKLVATQLIIVLTKKDSVVSKPKESIVSEMRQSRYLQRLAADPQSNEPIDYTQVQIKECSITQGLGLEDIFQSLAPAG